MANANANGITVTFSCPGDAMYDDKAQARHVAGQLRDEFKTLWIETAHEDHFHVLDTGIAIP